MDGRRVCGGAAPDGRVCGGAWLWHGNGYISAEGLGREPAKVLGHADSDGLLHEWPCGGRGGRGGSAAGERASGGVAGTGGDHAAGRFAAGAGAGVREYDLPGVRRTGAARDRHDGHVRRLELVLLPVYGCEERRGAVCFSEGELLVSDRPVHWRGRARDSAPDLLALLDEGDAGFGDDPERRARGAAVYAGDGDQGRREDVEVEGQRGVARLDDRALWRGCDADVCAVCGAAGPGPRLAGRRSRGD